MTPTGGAPYRGHHSGRNLRIGEGRDASKRMGRLPVVGAVESAAGTCDVGSQVHVQEQVQVHAPGTGTGTIFKVS